MNLLPHEIAQLRRGIVIYATKYEEELEDMPIDGLLSFLTGETGRQITQETLKEIFYYELHEVDEVLSMEDQNHIGILSQYISEEYKSLERIGTFARKPICKMTTWEIRETMVRMFKMTDKEYIRTAIQTGVELDEDEIERDHGQDIDSIILAGLLRANGYAIGREGIIKLISDGRHDPNHLQNEQEPYSGIFGLHLLYHE